MKIVFLSLFIFSLADGMLTSSNLRPSTFSDHVRSVLVRSFSCFSSDPEFVFAKGNGGLKKQFHRTLHGSPFGPIGIGLALCGKSVVTYYHQKRQESAPHEDIWVGLYGVGVAMMMYSNFHKQDGDDEQENEKIIK